MTDLIYNDTIKRIQNSTEDIQALKDLAKKHLERLQSLKDKPSITIKSKNFKPRHIRKKPGDKIESVDNNYFKTEKQTQQHQEFLLNNICGEIRAFSPRKQPPLPPPRFLQPQWQQQIIAKTVNVTRNTTKTSDKSPCGRGIFEAGGKDFVRIDIGCETLPRYLQLATDYYQQGFVKNIEYLQNVGERNQIRRKRQLQLQQQQQQLKQQQQLNRELSATTTNSCAIITTFSVKTPVITFANSNATTTQARNLTVNEFPPPDTSESPCNIRVNIKPHETAAPGLTVNRNGNLKQFKGIYGKSFNRRQQQEEDIYSMNDYLNGNFLYTQLQQQQQQQTDQHIQQRQYLPHTLEHEHEQQQQQFVNNHNNYPAKEFLIDSLIDNLKELDLQKENRTNLPRITLTDYTNTNTTTATANAILTNTNELYADHHNQHTLLEQENKKKLIDHSKLQQTHRLDCCSQLEIPLDTHYHSEARPP